MATPDPEILQKIGAAMAAATPERWLRATLFVSAVSSTTDTKLSIETPDGPPDRSRGVDIDAQFACDDLRDAMYTEGGGTWYNATLTLAADGQLTTDFDYDNPPFNGDYTDEMLEDDQEAYPRDQEHLPSWHPSRKS